MQIIADLSAKLWWEDFLAGESGEEEKKKGRHADRMGEERKRGRWRGRGREVQWAQERRRKMEEKEKGGKSLPVGQWYLAAFGAKVPPVNNTHNVLLKKQKRTCSSLANGNNHQCTYKQVLEHMFYERPKNCNLLVFFQVASNLLCSQLLSGVHNPKSQ